MEYVQTVMAQVAATKVDEALAPGGLLSEVESHRDFLAGQRGSEGMRITRTTNPEGNMLLVVETRWSNNNALADYSSQTSNVAAIIKKHEGVTVPDSLQIHRMEAVTSEKAEAPTRVYDRLALALFVPLGVLAFALVCIYALSRIYLALPDAAATPLAAGVALAILALAYYFATNPAVPRWQLAALAIVVVGGLGVGGTAAAIYDEENKTVHTPETPEPNGDGGADGTEIIMLDNEFEQTELTIAAGEAVTLTAVNKGAAVHNVHVAVGGDFEKDFCAASDPGCTTPATIPGGQSGTVELNVPAGTYDFRCDFHPTEMQGTITAQ